MAQDMPNGEESYTPIRTFDGEESTDLGASVSDLLGRIGKTQETQETQETETQETQETQETESQKEAQDLLEAHKAMKDTDNRIRRALEEDLIVDSEAFKNTFAHKVHSGSGSTYVVNTEMGACTCPDYEYRGITCKHLYAAYFHIGLDPIAHKGANCVACDTAPFCLAHKA